MLTDVLVYSSLLFPVLFLLYLIFSCLLYYFCFPSDVCAVLLFFSTFLLLFPRSRTVSSVRKKQNSY